MPVFRDLLDKSIRRITDPVAEPLTVTEAKAHCSVPVEVTNFDAQFREWIQSAREQVEADSERCLMVQEWELAMERFMAPTSFYSGNLSPMTYNCRAIELRKVPVIAITGFSYWNTAGALTSMVENTDYLLNIASEPGLITPPALGQLPANSTTWPLMNPRLRGVVITWTAGYASASAVPGIAKQAMRMLIAHWWRNREATGERPNKDHDRAYGGLINALKWRD